MYDLISWAQEQERQGQSMGATSPSPRGGRPSCLRPGQSPGVLRDTSAPPTRGREGNEGLMGYGIVGSRYVRQYRLKDGTSHWSLWEYKAEGEPDTVSSSGRRVRVGTAHTEAEVAQFLGMVDKEIGGGKGRLGSPREGVVREDGDPPRPGDPAKRLAPGHRGSALNKIRIESTESANARSPLPTGGGLFRVTPSPS
jgi:hypothetical protein